MLSISAISNGDYYLDLAQEDYYIAGGEPPGLWLGRGAAKLGLRGQVRREQLSSLLRGFAPDGTPLVQLQSTHDRERRKGWDLTFSAPKSVSILWACSDETTRRKLQQLHLEAVQDAIDYLQEEVAFSRRGKGGKVRDRADLIVACFEHGTSRALNPALHTHALLINVGVRSDGTTGAILSNPFYWHKMTVGALYRASLSAGIEQNLRKRVKRVKSWFEIVGVSQRLIKSVSKRRQAILKQLGLKGHHSSRAAAVAALETRDRKEVPPRSELFRRWQPLFDRICLQSVPKRDPDPVKMFRAAVREAIMNLSEVQTHFTERELLRFTAQASQGRRLDAKSIRTRVRNEINTSPDIIFLAVPKSQKEVSHQSEPNLPRTPDTKAGRQSQARTSQELANDRLDQVRGDAQREDSADSGHTRQQERRKQNEKRQSRADANQQTCPKGSCQLPEPLYATRDMIQLEARMIKNSRHMAGDRSHKLDRRLVERVIARPEFKLNEEQARAVRKITLDRGALQIVSGFSGTGKTLMLKAARRAWRKSGFQVYGIAVAGKAARGLQNSTGIKSETVALRLLQLDNNPLRKIKHHVLQVLKQSIRRPTFKLEKFKLNRRSIVVLDEASMVGTRDLAKLIKAVRERGAKLVLVGDFGQLQSIQAGGAFAFLAKLIGHSNLIEVIRQKEWGNDKEPDWTRKAVREFAKGDATTALKRYADRGYLHVGKSRKSAMERLVRDWGKCGRKKRAQHLILASTNDEVKALNQLCQQERRRRGEIGRLPLICPKGTFYRGDRVLITAKSRRYDIDNGELGTVVGGSLLGHKLRIKLDDGRKVTTSARKVDMQLGYALTVHKAQGVTVDYAYVLLGGAMQDREMSYTQASRAVWLTRFYTDKFEAGKNSEGLSKSMAGSRITSKNTCSRRIGR